MSEFKKLLSFFFTLITALLCFIFYGNQNCFAIKTGGEDNCVKIAVNNSQRLTVLPDDFNISPTPDPGNDFYILELKFEEIKCGYIFLNLNDMHKNTYLVDSDSKSYQVIDQLLQGFQIEDPTDIMSEQVVADHRRVGRRAG